MKILKLVSLNQHILLVFYSSNSCYQFSIISPEGWVYEPKDIFKDACTADRQGRMTIHFAS